MSIGLLANTGLRRLTPLVMCPIVFYCVLSCTRLLMSYDLDASPVLTISEFFGCRCFVLKDGNLNKFECRSSDGIFLGYASHSRAYCMLIIDTNIIRETCEVTFDEIAPCNSSVFEVAGDDELGTPHL